MGGGGGGCGRKIGGQGFFKLAKRAGYCFFWYKDRGGPMINQDLKEVNSRKSD